MSYEDLISIGTGMAFGYFFYLKDAVFKRNNSENDLKTRIKNLEARDGFTLTAKKILILVPFLRNSDIGIAWKTADDVKKNVAGTKDRKYELPFYKFEADSKEMIFVILSAQCLDVLPKIRLKGKQLSNDEILKTTKQFFDVLKYLLDSYLSKIKIGYKLIKYESDNWHDAVLNNYNEPYVLTKRRPDSLTTENLGKGLAYWYFYNYLHKIAPEMQPSINKGQTDWKYQLISKKLFIIVPNSCYCPSDVIEFDDPYIEYARNLHHNPSKGNEREYQTSVIRIKFGRNPAVFCLAEFATPIRQLCRMVDKGFVDEDDKNVHRNDFSTCLNQLLKTKLDHNREAKFSDLFEVIHLMDDNSNAESVLSKILYNKIKSSCRRNSL